MNYNNEKLNEIFRDTWPNLGWAKRNMENEFAGNYPGPLYAPHPDIKKVTHEEMLEEAAKREEANERPFYRFFAIEYFATGEGMSYWLKVCRNHDLYNNIDYDLERFVKFIGVVLTITFMV